MNTYDQSDFDIRITSHMQGTNTDFNNGSLTKSKNLMVTHTNANTYRAEDGMMSPS
jgi:hypothetical protein